MSTSSLPRRAAAWTVLTVAATFLLGAPADAAPGDGGDVEIHVMGTAVAPHLDGPKICSLYLDAVGFDRAQGIDWTIEPQPARRGAVTLSSSLALVDGAATSDNLLLPAARYKVSWTVVHDKGAGEHKVFEVDCPNEPGGAPSGSPNAASGGGGPGGGDGGSNGGSPADGSGPARDNAFSPVAGSAAVGLAAVGGVAWFRLRRRAREPHSTAGTR
ncbi:MULTISPECIES: hypothetical protein [Streptomyces]|uniref:hypothetical protein n=1 Tax=Streptomyces TaxID=1883 RepID=UPI002930E849|nr:hypothetical protein [Streptomyces sp. NEAU-HV9]